MSTEYENNTDSRIRIAHVVLSLDTGGLERIVASLVNNVDRARFASAVYCLENEGVIMDEVRDACFRTRVMNKKPGLAWSLPFRMAGMLRKDSVDIVHCHNFGALVYGGTGGRLRRVRGIVYTVHGSEMSSRTMHAAFQRMPVTDKVVAVSDYVRKSAIDKVGLDPGKVVTIRNGIDVNRYARRSDRRRMRERFGVLNDEVLVGIVARLTAEKDHIMLFEAFSRVVGDHRNVRLIVVGDGDLMEGLKDAVRSLGLTDSVVFLGNRDDVPELLSMLDLFVLSSREEGLGITLLEAMAAGLPVVATDAGGIPEIVEHEKTGLIVPSGDPETFADAIKWMLSHRDEAEHMAMEGKERVAKQFGFQHMIKQYEATYDEVLCSERGATNE